MTQDLAYFRQGCAGPQELCCSGMTQAMRMDASETRTPGRIRHDAADAACAESVMRREVPDEHGPPLSVSRSGMTQILGQ